MNLARYDLETHSLEPLSVFNGLTPEGLRALSLEFQLAAIMEGEPVSGILVGWQDSPSDYLGVFVLGDMVDQQIQQTMLDRIRYLVRGH